MAWFKSKKLKNYVSEIDTFLNEFDTQPEAHSDSRRKEEAKYAKIAEQRDNDARDESASEIWEQF